MRRTVPAAGLRRLVTAAAALGLALLAQSLLPNAPATDVALLFGLAVALYLFAMPAAGVHLQGGTVPRLTSSTLLWLGGALLAVAALLTGLALPRFTTAMPSAGGWGLHLWALAATIAGGLLLDQALRPDSAGGVTTGLRRRWIPLTLAGTLAVAALLRLPALETFPTGIWHDEAANALAARAILSGEGNPFYLESTFHTAHYNYLVALAFGWLGPTIGASRLVSALMGILMVAAGYLAASEIYRGAPVRGRAGGSTAPVMGLIFAALLAVSSWSLNFSRMGVNYIATPLFILLAVGFVLRALRTQRLGCWLWAGLALGMGLNFYTSFRLFVPVLPLFVLAAGIARCDLWKASWRGLLLFVFAGLLASGPLLTFAVTNRDTFLERTGETFVLRGVPDGEELQTLWENTRKHLLMFNWRGDVNGRHNLPGRPMLDPVLAGLFVVGLAICLWRWRRPGYLLLLLWLAFTLLGGILTLAFESPQSLRANGSIPAAYLIALLPVAELLRLWEESDGGRYYPAVGPGVVTLALLPVAVWHLHGYYFVQRTAFPVWNAFSTPETLTGRALAEINPDAVDAYVISFYAGSPVIEWLAPQWHGRYRSLEGTTAMPMAWSGDKGVRLFLDADSRVLFQQLQMLYPTALFVEHTSPHDNSVSLREVHLPQSALTSVQGLSGAYYANGSWLGEPARREQTPNLSLNWESEPPLPMPFSAEWQGVLRVEEWGDHELRLVSPGPAELWINETSVLSGTRDSTVTLRLATGNHQLRVRAVGGPGTVQLIWRPPGEAEQIIPASHLFKEPVAANGLLGRVFANDQWRGPEVWAAIDPQMNIVYHVTPVPQPFTVEWTGKIAIPQGGRYLFALEAIDDARLEIDGREIVTTRAPGITEDGPAELEAGLHDIRVLYAARTTHSRINLQWVPPGGERVPVPGRVLFPPMGDYGNVDMPILAALAPPPVATLPPSQPEAVAPADEPRPLSSDIRIVATGLADPSGVAAGKDGAVFAVDTGNRRVLRLEPSSEEGTPLVGGEEDFGEPFDAGTDGEGNLYVLDSEAATIAVFGPDGTYERTIRPQPALVSRARGLFVAPSGELWIANTPGQRIVVLDSEGELVREFPVWPDQNAQVTDVVVSADGSIFAAVLGINKLVRYDAEGVRVLSWDIPPANTMEGPHLALDAQGALYVTQPEESRIARYTPDGVQTGYWQLPLPPDMVKPVGIAIQSTGGGPVLWVTDSQSGRLVRVEPAP